jgi:HEPN domain-containing protein
MERKNVSLSNVQRRELEEIVNLLIGQYKTEYVICFGCLNDLKETTSCFIETVQENNVHYFLLMITTEITRIEHEVQDYVNRHFKVGVTIIVHGLDTVTNAIFEGSRFFTAACRDGIQLYTASGLRLNIDYSNLNTATTLVNAEKHYHHRYCMALGFLEAADECFDKGYFNNTVFMLHQAVEQACIAMIRVFMAYRSDMHNLSRLLNLCLCFSGEPAALFPRKTGEEQRLFQLLLKSYSDARYRDEYKIDSTDANMLCTQVRALLELTEELCTKKLIQYRQAAEEADHKVVDNSPALPASLP